MRETLYLFGVVLALTIVSIAWIIWRARRRTKLMAAVASQLGFSFEADGHAYIAQGLSQVPLFALASMCRGKLTNVLRGSSSGTTMMVLDCSYQTGSTASQQRDYAQTVACFPAEGLPAFTLRPEDEMPPRFALGAAEVLAGIGKSIPGGDARWQLLQQTLGKIEDPGIEFETHPKFTRSYRLRAANRQEALALFQPAILDFFERQPATVSVESAGSWLILYRRKKLVPPREFPEFLEQTVAISRLFSPPARRA